MQGLCLVIAAVLVQAKAISSAVEDFESMVILVPLVFLGFQAGGQVWTSEVLGFKEIPIMVLTSVYFGLASDVKLLQRFKKNLPRTRRFVAVASFLLGAILRWLAE